MRRFCLPFLLCSAVCLLGLAAWAQQSRPNTRLRAFTLVKPAHSAAGNVVRPEDSVSSLATFTYHVISSRDGNTYTGVMVGQDPFTPGFTQTTVTTPIVPLIITTILPVRGRPPRCRRRGTGHLDFSRPYLVSLPLGAILRVDYEGPAHRQSAGAHPVRGRGGSSDPLRSVAARLAPQSSLDT